MLWISGIYPQAFVHNAMSLWINRLIYALLRCFFSPCDPQAARLDFGRTALIVEVNYMIYTGYGVCAAVLGVHPRIHSPY